MKKVFSFLLLSILFITCSDPDPCEGIVCENGGTCANGACKCTERYQGPDCTDQVTPTNVILKKIEVLKFPATDAGGGGWDLTSGADIFVAVADEDDELIYDSPTYIENANPAVIHTFTMSVDLDANTDYSVLLYDYDSGDPNDYLGGVVGPIYTSANGFPTTMTVDAGGSVAFRLTFEYEFD